MLPATHAIAHGLDGGRVALVLLAVGMALFGRLVLRILLAVFVIAAGAGVLVLLQGLHQ